jgi:pyruvate dehydrogenase E2 component (dihydrolipoyllysine-residue acetyltransferase)
LEIPKVGLVMEQARLVRWLKQVGDAVTQGEPLLELETEKSLVEIESTETGRLAEQLLAVDAEVHIGDQAAWLETDNIEADKPEVDKAESPSSPRAAPSETSANSSARATPPTNAGSGAIARAEIQRAAAPGAVRGAESSASSTGDAPGAGGASSAGSASGMRIMCSPVARRLASQAGLDLRTVRGTGPRGRIQLSDVRHAIEGKAPPSGPQPLSSMRRAVARSMTLSATTIPQFIVSQSVDWTAVQGKRTELNAQLGHGAAKITVNDFLLQAIARALLTYPALNSTFRGDPNSPDAAIVPAHGAHIGLVVAVENGLLVPILHDVQQVGLAELARRRADTVDRALKGRLKQAELEGGTFSLSNLGARGPDRFTAIVNPPQSAILAVGRQRDCVVAINGGIHVRPMSELSLTVDHRVADGRLASEFLRYLVEILEGNEWRA